MHSKSHRALAVEASLFDPSVVGVAGLASSPSGMRYADSFANDSRHETEWHPVQHERVLLTMFATARTQVTPSGQPFNVPQGDAARVYLFNLAEERPGCIQDDAGFFDLLFEDGRQRRMLVGVAGQRLEWIRQTFVGPLWAEEKDPVARRVALRNRLLDYGASKLRDGADPNTLPPLAEGDTAPVVGESVAPWLDEAMVQALCAEPEPGTLLGDVPVSSVRWFSDEGDVVPMGLELRVIGEDVDVFGDYRVLLDNMRRKEAQVFTTYAVRGEQIKRMLAAKDDEGKPRFTPHSLALELKVSKDWVNNAIYYQEIADVVRDAVDAGRIGLKLAVTGRECVCYGFDKQGKRSLLSAAEQAAIYSKLVEHFRVEIVAEDGIGDNLVTRQVLKKIKSDVLAGTPFVEGMDKTGPRETASVRNSRDAADRAGVTSSRGEEIDPETKKSLAEAAADADRDADEGDSDAEPKTSKKAPGGAKEPPSADPPARDPRKLREQLLARAKAHGVDAAAVDLRKKTTPELDAVALAAGLAVLDALGGDSSALLRFPVLSRAQGTKSPAKAASKPVKGKAAEGSPFALADAARGVLATLVDLWAAKKDESFDPRKLVNDAAEQELGSKATAEVIAEAAKQLEAALDAFKKNPSHPKLEIHLREFIAG